MNEGGEFTVYGKSPPCTMPILRHGGHGKGAVSVSGRALHPNREMTKLYLLQTPQARGACE